MSIKHVNDYFDQMKEQYYEMIDNTLEFKELLAENRITQKRYKEALKEINIVKANYERLVYIKWLLDQPDDYEKAQEVEILFDGPETSTQAAVVEENNKALNKMKMIKDINND